MRTDLVTNINQYLPASNTVDRYYALQRPERRHRGQCKRAANDISIHQEVGIQQACIQNVTLFYTYLESILITLSRGLF